MKKPELMRILRALILIIPAVVFGGLVMRYTAFTGHLQLEYDFSGESSTVSEWTPRGRVTDRLKNLRTGETYQEVSGEPIYLTAQVPRSFDRVEATLEYTNEEQPLLEVGLVTSEDPWAVRIAPLESKVIDQALNEWDVMTENGVTLLQRTKRFFSIGEFTANAPHDQGIGLYRQPLNIMYTDPAYQATDATHTIDRVLRGPHEFATYIKEERLHVAFDVVDMNREFNVDTVTVQLFNQHEQLHEEILVDDGIVDASATPSARKTVTLDLPDLPEGLYIIKLQATNDILLPRIFTEQDRFVVKNKLFLASTEEYQQAVPDLNTGSSTIYANINRLAAKTDHITALQTIRIDEREALPITSTHDLFTWVGEEQHVNPFRALYIPVNDVSLLTYGYFAFSEDAFFDPDYFVAPIDDTSTMLTFDYILMRDYTPPVKLSNKHTQQTSRFSLDGVAGDRKELQFLLSAPGIDRNAYTTQLYRIQLDFYRDPLWALVKHRISSFIK